MNTAERTLGELVTAYPAAAHVFYRYRLDFCCGGKQSLQQACAAENLDADVVLREVEVAGAGAGVGVGEQQGSEQQGTVQRWDQRPLAELVDHILDVYHAPLRPELQRLLELARKVETSHADKPDCPRGLTHLLANIQAAVESHLAKEEQILFPAIVAGRGKTAHMPVQVMIQEHEDHGQNLRRIRELTHNLRLPADACATWRELVRSLARFEADLMLHIHLENNILFPRALAAG